MVIIGLCVMWALLIWLAVIVQDEVEAGIRQGTYL